MASSSGLTVENIDKGDKRSLKLFKSYTNIGMISLPW